MVAAIACLPLRTSRRLWIDAESRRLVVADPRSGMRRHFFGKGGKMLVLGRKEGESIVIGNRIRVVISKIRGNRVWVAIDAPDWVNIRREEVPATEPKKDEVTS